jgi:hypothetical protein
MSDAPITEDQEAEWLRRMKAVKAGRIPDEVYAEITEDMRLTSVLRAGGQSHLRLYWITLQILEEVTAAGHWTPQQASDLIATTVEIKAKEGKS